LLAAKFNELDEYTIKNTQNRPDVAKDQKLDRWELNHKYPMWEVSTLLSTYATDTDKSYLSILEYAQS